MIEFFIAAIAFYFGMMVTALFSLNAYDKGYQDALDEVNRPQPRSEVTECAVCNEPMNGRHERWSSCCSANCARNFYD